MGYRSDVKYVLLFESNEGYSKFLGEATLMCGDDPQLAEVLRLLVDGKQVFDGRPTQSRTMERPN